MSDIAVPQKNSLTLLFTKFVIFFRNPALSWFANLMIISGIADFLYRLCSRKLLADRKKFYEKNAEKILSNIKCLADYESVRTYIGMIEYRKIMKRKYFPGYTGNQYFPEDIIKLTDDEVFVDCGAYDGDTIIEFINRTRSFYKKIIGFEPDSKNFKKLQEYVVQEDTSIKLYNYGNWNKKDKLLFNQQENTASAIAENGNGNEIIEVIDLDSVEECQDATYIKMDIEGAELEALEGAKNIIAKNKPKLAICIYHNDRDMIDIIDYVHKLVPEYKIFIRHHTCVTNETVMYCTI